MFSDFSKALAQLADRKFLWVLAKSLVLTMALFAGAFYGIVYLATAVLPATLNLPWMDPVPLGDWFSGLAFVGVLVSSVFLMFPIALLFVGLFLEEITDAVEARYYPELPKVKRSSISDTIGEVLQFMLIMLLANLFALIIYFMSSLLAPVIFWIVNGYLLGREYFQLVAMRRMGRKDASKLRRENGLKIWISGIFMAIPLTIPVLNIVVPFLGVATFTHQFHRLNGRVPTQRDTPADAAKRTIDRQ